MQDRAIEMTSEKIKVLTRLSRIVLIISDLNFSKFQNFGWLLDECAEKIFIDQILMLDLTTF
jgi:hypothetical protein